MGTKNGTLVDAERSNALLVALSKVAEEFSYTSSPEDMLERLALELKFLNIDFYFCFVDQGKNVAEIQFVSPGRRVLRRLERVFGAKVIGYQLQKAQWPPMAVEAIEKREIVFVEDFLSDAQQVFHEFPGSMTQLGLELVNISNITHGIHIAHEFRDGTVGVLTIWSDKLRKSDIQIFSIFSSLFASIYDHLRLLEAEQDQSAELITANSLIEALSQVAASVAMVSDVESVITSMGEELKKIGLDSLVVLLDPETKEGYIRYHSIYPRIMRRAELITNRVFSEQRLPIDEWPVIIQRVIKDNKAIYIENFLDTVISFMGPGVPTAIAKLANKFLGISARTKGFFLPLENQGKVFGCLSIWEDNLNNNNLSAFQVFSLQIAIAFESARLKALEQEQAKALTRANTFLATLSRITSRVKATTKREEVIGIVEEELQSVGLSSAGFSVNQFTLETTLLKQPSENAWVVKFAELAGLHTENLSFSISSLPDEVLSTFLDHDLLFIKDIIGFYKNTLSGFPWRKLSRILDLAGITDNSSGILFPLLVENESILGFILWGEDLRNEDIATFKIYQSQLSSVLETVRLYQVIEAENLERKRIEKDLIKYKEQLETEVKNRTNELHQRNIDLELEVVERKTAEVSEREHRAFSDALENTAYVLNQTQDLDEILDRILLNLKSVIPHDSANIMLLDEDGTATVVRYKGNPLHPPPSERAFSNFSVSDTPTLQRMKNSLEPMFLSNVDIESEWIPQMGSEWIKSYVAAPIYYGDKVLGYLNLVSSKGGFYTATHAERLLAFANHASIAIRNVHLFNQAREIAILEERQRLAREMHDGVSQTLFTASVISESLHQQWERSPEKGREGLDKITRLTRGALAEMRSILVELRPGALVESDLGELIEQLGKGAMSYLELTMSSNLNGRHKLPENVQLPLYRMAQEVFNNIVKHARATHVSIDYENTGDYVYISISDNGKGFDTQGLRENSFGLKIMQERADRIGASLNVISEPHEGTNVVIVWESSQQDLLEY